MIRRLLSLFRRRNRYAAPPDVRAWRKAHWLVIVAVALVAAPASAGSVPTPADAVFPRGLPWAPSEDACYSYRCVWDARHQGNGEGQSLIITKFGRTFVMRPISHQRAHRLQAAWCARKDVACGYAD